MSTNIVVGQDLTPGWLKKRANAFSEIDRQLIQGLESPGNGLTLEHLQMLIEHRNPFPVVDEILAGWKTFYKELFGLECDFANLVIPKRRKGFDRLIVVAKGMTPNRVFVKMKELFPSWRYAEHLDEIVSERKADRDYTIWVRDRAEADEELKNLSANDLKIKNVPGITLEERLLYELKLFKETGEHLDVKNVTLCSGSWFPDGGVPCVRLNGHGEVSVSWRSPSGRGDDIRSRQVVS